MTEHEISQKLLSEAHERSALALSAVKAHEKVCEERYKGIDSKLSDIKDGQDKANGRMWIIAGTIIMLLISILGYITSLGVEHLQAEMNQSLVETIAEATDG